MEAGAGFLWALAFLANTLVATPAFVGVAGEGPNEFELPVAHRDFRWEAPKGCPKQDEVWQRLQRKLVAAKGGGADESASQLSVSIQVLTHEGGFRATLKILTAAEKGQADTNATQTVRRFDGIDCNSIADASVLVVAAIVDPTLLLTESEPTGPAVETANAVSDSQGSSEPNQGRLEIEDEKADEERLETSSQPENDNRVVDEESSKNQVGQQGTAPEDTKPGDVRRRSPKQQKLIFNLFGRLGGAAELGVLPQVAPTFDGALGLDFGARPKGQGPQHASPPWRMELEGRLSPPQIYARHESSNGKQGGRFSLYAAQLLFCGQLPMSKSSARWFGQLCTGVDAGAIQGEGYRLQTDRSSTRPRVAARLEPRLRFLLNSRLAFVLRAGASLVLQRPRFEAEGIGEVYQAQIWSLNLGLGFEFGRFGLSGPD